CYAGRADEADTVLAPFRAAGPVLADLVRPQAYPELFAVGAGQAGMQVALRTGFGFDEARTQTAIDLVRTAPTEGAVVNLRPMGGAIARLPAGDTAFAHRHEQVMVIVAALDPAELGPGRTREWVHEA